MTADIQTRTDREHLQDNHGGAVAAVENRRRVTFTYRGHRRVVEPHALGFDDADRPLLLGRQVGGDTHDGVVPERRVFRLREAEALTVTDDAVAAEVLPADPTHPTLDRVVFAVDGT